MTQTPIRSKHPSRCAVCAKDVRRGDVIRYLPADAGPGDQRRWVHELCAAVPF